MAKRTNVAIIQARLGSQRLPEKVLCDLDGRPMLDWVVQRVRRATSIDKVVIATSIHPRDKRIVDHCRNRNWLVFAGPENDVLSRFVQAATEFGAETVTRVTADCPLIDPNVIDQVVNLLQGNPELDYCCNFLPQRTFPRGLDIECLTIDALHRVNKTADDPQLREHVTLGIYRRPSQFSIGSIRCPKDHSDFRWTVDTVDDLRLIRSILAHFHDDCFSWQDVISSYAQHPCWHEINAHVRQKAA